MKKSISNWGNYPVIQANEYSFSVLNELKKNLQNAEVGIARGMGRCYGDASLADSVFSTLKLNHILGFNPSTGIIEVESGITLDSILDFIVPQAWFLPVTPGTKYITVGGAVASDVHGKNHHAEGCFRHHVLEMDVMVEDGTLLTCSPTLHADLFDATCGGMGLTGVITRVKFQLKKIETAYIKQKMIKAKNLNEIIELLDTYSTYTYSVAWIDCLKSGDGFGRSILMLGEHAKVEDLPERLQKSPLQLPKKKLINLPFFLPSFLLNRLSVSIFNFLYYHKMLKREINNVVAYEPFFYPLDAIQNWNRGYGKKGFVQYQFVLPLESREGLVKILKKIASNGHASFLAVLKIFGDDESLISFPMKGYTLALDLPVRKNLFPFLDELDALVLEYKGRIYLSKDARMKSNVFFESYPHAQKFISILQKYSPLKFISHQSKRLNIKS
jgi:FAD/FMN-containing dehydrogenase